MSVFAFVIAAVLMGETDRPLDSCYAIGEKPVVILSGTNFAAEVSLALSVSVKDTWEREAFTSSDTVRTDGEGRFSYRLEGLPNDRYDSYRVYVTAGDVKLRQLGTRGEGYLTYGIFPDPKKRPSLSEDEAFLGIHGGNTCQAPWLGAHWRLDQLSETCKWPSGDADQFRELERVIEKQGWTSYQIITASRIFQRPALYPEGAREYFGGSFPWIWKQISTPQGAEYYRQAIENLAKCAVGAENRGQKKRIYELFWEPELQYKESKELIAAAKIAYPAIKKHDPEAIVTCPTPYTINSYTTFADYFEQGLADYMDAISIHPYGNTEGDDFPGKIDALKRLARKYKGREVDFYGTEAGDNSGVEARDEYRKAARDVRKALVLLGEGFRMHHYFYGFDWGSDGNDISLGGSGLAYHLDYPAHRWRPIHISPKPSFAAMSGFSLLVDGCRPTCRIDDLGSSRFGYAYSDKDERRCVVALWDYAQTSEVEFVSGRDETVLADMMGNTRVEKTPGGKLKLGLSPDPVYVVNADPALWGRNGRHAKALRARQAEKTDPIHVTDISALAGRDGPGVVVKVQNESDRPLEVTVGTRIRGVPEARRKATVSLESGGESEVRFTFAGWEAKALETYSVEVSAESGPYRDRSEARIGFYAAAFDDFGEPVAYPDGTFAFAWNRKGVYLKLTASKAELEVKFAWQALKNQSDNGFAVAMSQAAQQLHIANGEVKRMTTFWSHSFPLGPLADARAKVTAGEGGKHEYLVFIPWAQLNITDLDKADSFHFSAPGIFETTDMNPKCFLRVNLKAEERPDDRRFWYNVK